MAFLLGFNLSPHSSHPEGAQSSNGKLAPMVLGPVGLGRASLSNHAPPPLTEPGILCTKCFESFPPIKRIKTTLKGLRG